MFKNIKKSLVFKLIIVVLTTNILIFGLIGMNVSTLMNRTINKHVQDHAKEIAPLINAAVAPLLFQEDVSSLNDFLDDTLGNQDFGIQYALVYDSFGKLFTQRGKIQPDQLPKLNTSTIDFGTKEIVHTSQLLSLGEEQIGSIHYGLSMLSFQATKQNFYRQINLIFFISTSVIILILFLIGLSYARQSRIFIHGVQELTNGNYNIQLDDQRQDEIGLIGKHFNEMAATVRERNQALSEAANQLEQRVKERTTELDKAQKALLNILEDLETSNQELGHANTKLQELDQLKSMFIASMSHELRTPLNAIIGFSSLILNGMTGEINKEQRDQLGRVYRSGKHLLALITDVIDISKIESGRIHPHVDDFLLAEVIEEACDSVKLQLEEKNLQLLKHCPEAPISLHSDRKRLLQCLLNYLSNAVKFTEAGTIALTVEADAETLTISVADSGVGISSEDLPRLFHSFVRLDSPLKTIVPGTGLGLYLTKKLATEVLGGEVWAESVHNKGSKFHLKLPKRID